MPTLLFDREGQEDPTVLVTGGSGLVGRALHDALLGHPPSTPYRWVFLSSKDGDLTKEADVAALFKTWRPTVVIHLAAMVGGLFRNMAQRAEMYEKNIHMNTLVLQHARHSGVRRVFCMLSTCVFPDGLEHLTCDDLHRGPPHPSNEGYAYAKRMMEVHARILSETSQTRVTCLTPTNIYGAYDNFDLEDAHVMPALMHRCLLAKRAGVPFVVRGTGKPLRQFIYNKDLARMILAALNMEDAPGHLLCTPPAEDQVTIGDVARHVARAMDYERALVFDASFGDGQFRKTASPSPQWEGFVFTPLEVGIAEAVAWFMEAHAAGTARGGGSRPPTTRGPLSG